MTCEKCTSFEPNLEAKPSNWDGSCKFLNIPRNANSKACQHKGEEEP